MIKTCVPKVFNRAEMARHDPLAHTRPGRKFDELAAPTPGKNASVVLAGDVFSATSLVIGKSSRSKNMGIIGRNALHALVADLEREAQRALAHDASFLEALRILKWQVDSDARVRAAIHALRNRGLTVFHSFVPRIRIRLCAGERVVALPNDVETRDTRDSEYSCPVAENMFEHPTQALRDAAGAAVSASPYSGELEKIVNEALEASPSFVRLAGGLERAGYELQVVLDLSAYARARKQTSNAAPLRDSEVSNDERSEGAAQSSRGSFNLPLSGQDVKFLRSLRIAP